VRQALVTLFSVAASQVVESETPPAFAHAIAGSIRHRGNKLDTCEVWELREFAAAFRAFAEIVLVCDARMARGLQGVAFCLDVQIDKEVAGSVPLVDGREVVVDESSRFLLSEREWRTCSTCRKQVVVRFTGVLDESSFLCWSCSSKLARSLTSTKAGES
jgi:hypothetical protein